MHLNIHFQPSPFEHEVSLTRVDSDASTPTAENSLAHGVDSHVIANTVPLQLHIDLDSQQQQPHLKRPICNVAEANAEIHKNRSTTQTKHKVCDGADAPVGLPSCQLQVVAVATAKGQASAGTQCTYSQNNVDMLELDDDNESKEENEETQEGQGGGHSFILNKLIHLSYSPCFLRAVRHRSAKCREGGTSIDVFATIPDLAYPDRPPT